MLIISPTHVFQQRTDSAKSMRKNEPYCTMFKTKKNRSGIHKHKNKNIQKKCTLFDDGSTYNYYRLFGSQMSRTTILNLLVLESKVIRESKMSTKSDRPKQPVSNWLRIIICDPVDPVGSWCSRYLKPNSRLFRIHLTIMANGSP